MANHILVDYTIVAPGSLKAIEYPLPFSVEIFLAKNSAVHNADLQWPQNSQITVDYISAPANGLASIPSLIAHRLGALMAGAGPMEIFVVSTATVLDPVIAKAKAGQKVERKHLLAALPIATGAPPVMPPSVKLARTGVLAGLMTAVFLSALVWFYFCLMSYAGEKGRALAFDFGSYALPAFAAVVVGLGLFFRRREGLLYFAAALLVMLGFFCYVLGKRELMDVVPGAPGFIAVATLWGVIGSFVGIAGAGLFFLDRVTLGPWQALKQLNAWYRVRRVAYLLGTAVIGASMLVLVGMFLNIKAHPNSWTAEGPFHELYKWISTWLV